MYEDKFNDFDLELRSMLSDVEEEVPSRVWDAVSARLDQKKIVALRWRRAAAGMAAAAAIVAGVLIFRHQPTQEVNPGDFLAKVDSVEVMVPSQVEEEVIPTIEEQIAHSRTFVAQAVQVTKEAEPEVVTEPNEDIVAEETVTEKTVETKPEVCEQQEKSSEPWVDPFAAFSEEISSKKHIDWKVGGNVTSNEASLASTIKRAIPQAAPSTTGIYNEGKSTYFIPVSFGLGVRYHFTDRWSVGTGLEYTLLSRSFTGRYMKFGASGCEKDITTEIQNSIHYIGVPVNVYFDILSSQERINLYAYAGGMMEKGLANDFTLSDRGTTIRHHETISGLQWSATAGLGVQFVLTDKLGLYLDPSLRYFFDCEQPMSVRTVQPLMFNFEVGLRLNL
ncbi:MAG: outer membrane beta-barrel protein [Bacteroidales bacterium]|nr:outer membrane beta-barrel protein [Bacteroidales bacterium]